MTVGPNSDRGQLVVVAGPSGVGKSTVVRRIVELDPEVHLSVSATTRTKREGEVDGIDYFFMNADDFAKLREEGGFLESAQFAGNSYGTPKREVEQRLDQGQIVLLEIELQGVRQVKAALPEAMTVFVAPPSWDVLRERLSGRGTEDEATIARRLEVAKTELAAQSEFDQVVVNDSVDDAARAIIALVCDT
ncbi:MAG: guanylate kinase [Candidatus Nanopelagicales bacterium]